MYIHYDNKRERETKPGTICTCCIHAPMTLTFYNDFGACPMGLVCVFCFGREPF